MKEGENTRVRVFFGFVHYALIFAAAFAAGSINSVAGGGTLITFPTLLWLGVSSKLANGTSTVALWPGAIASMYGYRHELAGKLAEGIHGSYSRRRIFGGPWCRSARMAVTP